MDPPEEKMGPSKRLIIVFRRRLRPDRSARCVSAWLGKVVSRRSHAAGACSDTTELRGGPRPGAMRPTSDNGPWQEA